jgi:hypothetical protein
LGNNSRIFTLQTGSIKPRPRVPDRLQAYCVEFSEFNKRCEQLCNAFDNIATHHDSISSFAVRGMKQNAVWLKKRMNEMKQKLESLCHDSYTDK